MKCFYHRADLDGRCSGAIVMQAHPECEAIGIDYGEDFPWSAVAAGERVVMVDFSLPFDDMERLNRHCRLTWIDHHASAMAEAQARGFLAGGGQVLENGRAACELCWDHFFPLSPMPGAVRLLGRYDVWDHANYPQALPMQYGMRAAGDWWPNHQDMWGRLFYDELWVGGLVDDGRLIGAYLAQQDAAYLAACGFEVEVGALRCLAVNRGLTNSRAFASRYDPDRHDAMLAFVWRHGVWRVSMYSDKPEVDVGLVCVAHGGGGHRGAAGFHCRELPFSLGRVGND